MRFYFDGALLLTTTAAPHTSNLSNFGDGITSSGNNADVDWDYITLIQQDNSVPEPSTWLLMGGGLVGLGWLRRRRTVRAGA